MIHMILLPRKYEFISVELSPNKDEFIEVKSSPSHEFIDIQPSPRQDELIEVELSPRQDEFFWVELSLSQDEFTKVGTSPSRYELISERLSATQDEFVWVELVCIWIYTRDYVGTLGQRLLLIPTTHPASRTPGVPFMQDNLFRYMDSHHKDKTVMRPPHDPPHNRCIFILFWESIYW